ncbi:winged helix-turn-helix domain-containing protein [Devosia sp. LjRoot16]|uniref:winged helix-turn-helix domain-containing protein n=1 Tax=Devosia sp. LjRoot16 TaxID=3342271 RepID=UPI003ECCAA7F
MDLRDEVEFLREENRQLKERLGLSPDNQFFLEARYRLRLQPQVARVLAALMGSPMVSKGELLEAMCDGWEERELKNVDVRIFHLRKALRPHGVEIETIWGQGYRLVPEMKTRVRQLLGLAEAA